MSSLLKASDVWEKDYTVLLTSYWGWDPERWGTLSFTEKGRRDRVRNLTTDPFIGLVYSTIASKYGNKEDRGRICGFYVVSHEDGDRFDLTDPASHSTEPSRWNYGLRPYAAFSFLPEDRIHIRDFWPQRISNGGGSSLAKSGDFVPASKCSPLRELPVEAANLFSKTTGGFEPQKNTRTKKWVPAFPDRKNGYWVGDRERDLPRRLYILRLHGDEDHFLKKPAEGRWIVKVGLSYSPQARCDEHQKMLPNGRFQWKILYGTPRNSDLHSYMAAQAGEFEMKKFLGKHGRHLGGEFYAATQDQIHDAWGHGSRAALYSSTEAG